MLYSGTKFFSQGTKLIISSDLLILRIYFICTLFICFSQCNICYFATLSILKGTHTTTPLLGGTTACNSHWIMYNILKNISKHHPNHLPHGTKLTMMLAYLEIWIQNPPFDHFNSMLPSRQGPSPPFIHRKDYQCCMNMTNQSTPEPLDFVIELESVERWWYLIPTLLAY